MSDPLAAAMPSLLSRAGVRAGARVLVAVSGGADSMALLHLLRFHSDPLALRLEVAHFDHRMRAGSVADAQWVRGVCTAWEVPLRSGSASGPLAGETTARSARWSFLLASARSSGADVVLTAHHADDQAETVLHRIVRGTGLPGLAAIPARRLTRVGEHRIAIVRPLLELSRADLRAYCRASGVRWREDPTNVLTGTARNRIRARVLPALERMRPGAGVRLAHIARLARAAEDAWEVALRDVRERVVRERTEDRIVLAREALLGYDPHIRSRVLRRELRRLGRAPGRSGTRAVDEFISYGTSGKGMALGAVRIERERDRIVLSRTRALSPDRALRITAPEAGAGSAQIGGRRVAVDWAPGPGPGGADTLEVDPSNIAFPLELRAWRPGDRIRMSYGGKKLKKLFLERGVGRAERARTPVLADAAGRVLWVYGLAQDAGPVTGAKGFHIRVVDD